MTEPFFTSRDHALKELEPGSVVLFNAGKPNGWDVGDTLRLIRLTRAAASHPDDRRIKLTGHRVHGGTPLPTTYLVDYRQIIDVSRHD